MFLCQLILFFCTSQVDIFPDFTTLYLHVFIVSSIDESTRVNFWINELISDLYSTLAHFALSFHLIFQFYSLALFFIDKIFLPGYIAYNFVIGAYSYWGPKAGYDIYHMVNSMSVYHSIFI